MTALRIALDTSAVIDLEKSGRRIPELSQTKRPTRRRLEFIRTTVTDREMNYYLKLGFDTRPMPEVFFLNESLLNVGRLGSGADRNTVESILRVISNGSFPAMKNRDQLTHGQRRQLRDALIFATVVSQALDIFVTNDATAFVKDNRRVSLEKYGTKIMTTKEFLEALPSL